MSGITVTPRSRRMASAWGVVGPFAPSATIVALTRSALSSRICEPTAAGTRTSHGRSLNSALLTGSGAREPVASPGDDAGGPRRALPGRAGGGVERVDDPPPRPLGAPRRAADDEGLARD